MTPEFVTSFFMEAIKTAILLSAPMLVVGLLTGVLVSIFQAATQINEMTMVFVPKMLGVALALLVFFPWMMKIIVGFTQNLFVNLPTYIR
ncbi:flagellar biosynthesis protein FliQ [Desulfosarcina sp. OttesenSCG-928-G10]|nr:flagellar biosynthesis protein FliQ [Desulfosarcina sp. OttesenSCG-928-G10]MDL2321749.1 flagellar biosynthesis protein FliQ [Desulfosarcina sp. OttesenSCG-928-B08]